MITNTSPFAHNHFVFIDGERQKGCVAVDYRANRALILKGSTAKGKIVSRPFTQDDYEVVWITGDIEIKTSRPDLCALVECECPRVQFTK